MTAKPITEYSGTLRCWDVRRMTWKGTNDTELGGEAYHSIVSYASLQGRRCYLLFPTAKPITEVSRPLRCRKTQKTR